jgi:sarcosine oxidase subunit beta
VNDYDAVVIGGGIIGLCVSYYLSKEKLRVLLLERYDLASGTSSKCDGNVLIHDKQPGFDTALAFASQLLWEELNRELDFDFEYKKRGSVLLIESEEERTAAEHFAGLQCQDGYPFRLLSQRSILEQEPHLCPDIVGAIEIECDASINPMAFIYGLSQTVRRSGVEVRLRTPVTGIGRDRCGAVQAVFTDRETFHTRCVVNCAGVWSPEIGAMVGIDIPVRPRQGQIIVSERTFTVADRKIVEFGYMMAKFGDRNYKRNVGSDMERNGIAFVFEPTRANNFLIGSSRIFTGYSTDVSLEVISAMARRAVRFFPVIKNINIIRTYAGLRPFTPDHLPIVSPVETVPGFYIATGHEGDGVGLAPITGKLISRMLVGKESEFPLDRLSFSRFGRNGGWGAEAPAADGRV